MKNQVQLITYVDRISSGGIAELAALLRGPLQGLLGSVHLLPFFYRIDGADAGFDPIDHTQVDPRLGTWEDLRHLGQIAEITADLIVNHISALSSQFQEFSRHGDASHFAGLFLTLDRASHREPRYGFMLVTAIAGLLFTLCLLNSIYQPARQRLRRLDESQYRLA